MGSVLYTEEFLVDPHEDPTAHGAVSGANAAQAWQETDQLLALEPGTRWRSPALAVQPLSYVRLSFRIKLAASTAPATPGQFNQNIVWFRSINPLATWNLDPANSGPSGGDLIAGDTTAPIGLSETWSEQVFYSRSQANATHISIQINATNDSLLIDDIRIESVDDLSEVDHWADQIWNNRPRDTSLTVNPSITGPVATEQQQRLRRTLSKLQSGQPVRIVLVGDSIVSDLANSGFDALLSKEFPGSTISVITAVGNGTGLDQWNPQNDTYPFISSNSYRGALNFNNAVIEQEPDLIILGGISTPANNNGYSAIQSIINKIQSNSVLSRLGYQPDILIASGAFGSLHLNWYPSAQLNATGKDYRSNLLKIANQNNTGFLDLTGIWGSFLMGNNNNSDPSAIKSQETLTDYWRDNTHANSLGKQILGRGLVNHLKDHASLNSQALPAISLSIQTEAMNEDSGNSLNFTLHRTGSTDSELEVGYTVGGTAKPGEDYIGIADTPSIKKIRFIAGSATATISLAPRADKTFEPNETILISLDSTSGVGYTIDTDHSVTGFINNDDLAPYVEAISNITDNTGTIQGIVASGGFTNDTTPTLNGTLSAALATGEVVTIYRNGSVAGNAKINATSLTWAFTTPTLSSNGSYSFTAAVVDAAGNQGTLSPAYSINLDTLAPTQTATITAIHDNVNPVQGLIAAGGSSNDPTPTISGTLTAPLSSGDKLLLYNGTTALIEATVDNATLTWIATPVLTSNATYSFSARVLDAAGNQGPASAARSFRLDTLAPTQTATINNITDNTGTIQGVIASGGVTNDTTPTLNGTLSAALATGEVVTIYRNGSVAGNAKINATSLTWAFTTPTLSSNGSYSFTAAVVDAAGNQGTLSPAYSINLDTLAPTQTATITAIHDNVNPVQGLIAAGGSSNDPTPTISGTLTAPLSSGDKLLLYNGTTALIEATVDNATLTWIATPVLTSNATYSFTARVLDAAGNQGPTSAARSFRLDTLAPTQTATISNITDNTGTIQGIVASGGFTNDTTPTLNGTLSAALATGEVVTIYRNGSVAGNAKINATSLTWAFTTPTLSSNGSYSFTAAVVDAAGNQGTLSPAYSINLDASSFDGNAWSYDWANASNLNGTPGLLQANIQVNNPRIGEPALRVTALRVDLQTPGLSLVSTGPIDNWQANARETLAQTTRDFITSNRQQGTPLVAAINTSFFALQGPGQAVATNLLGLNISNQALVSPIQSNYPYFILDSITGARLERDPAVTPNLDTAKLAFSGMSNGIVLWDNIVTWSAEQSTDLNARAALGLSSDHQYLYLMTVDRTVRNPVTSSFWGATLNDVGALLSGLGASKGLNLDGGGSTQMASWNPGTSTAQLLNSPILGIERHVGSNLGIAYQPPI